MEKDSLNSKYQLVVIGGSAGSLEVLLHMLPELETNLPFAIIIVIHRKNTSDSTLTSLLTSKTKMKVKEAEEKEALLPGIIYIAPADYHLLIEKDHTISLDDSEKINFSRPSIDATFDCAAEVYGNALACILLSGASADGVEGLKTVKQKKGIVAVQDPDNADVSYMPQQAIQHVAVDHVLTISQMAAFVNSLA